jgi:hypothetical protein
MKPIRKIKIGQRVMHFCPIVGYRSGTVTRKSLAGRLMIGWDDSTFKPSYIWQNFEVIA